MLDEKDISQHEERFAAFVAAMLREHPGPMLELKREHTGFVLENARRIVAGEKFTPARPALLAALYHDIGRFPQFIRWKTFSDAQSVSHGYLGVHTLKEQGLLDDEPTLVRGLTLAAVGLHNRHTLPCHLDPIAGRVTSVVRDADKIDIMRIMAIHLNAPLPSEDVVLHVKDDPDAWSDHIVRTVLSGDVPKYAELRYVNDFRMLLGSWLRDLHFSTSRRELATSGTLEGVLSGLPDVPALRPVKEVLFGLLKTHQR